VERADAVRQILDSWGVQVQAAAEANEIAWAPTETEGQGAIIIRATRASAPETAPDSP
jgi:hypothetical protein